MCGCGSAWVRECVDAGGWHVRWCVSHGAYCGKIVCVRETHLLGVCAIRGSTDFPDRVKIGGMRYSNHPTHPTGRGPGRRRDITKRILDAALELIAEDGYGSCSIEAISAKSGVAKPTIYRRYSNRHEVAMAALERGLTVLSVPNSGYLEIDVRAMIAVMVEGHLRGPGVRFLSTVIVEEKRHPELLAVVRQRWIWPRQRLIKTVLERAKRRGELRAGIDLDVATTMIWGAPPASRFRSRR